MFKSKYQIHPTPPTISISYTQQTKLIKCQTCKLPFCTCTYIQTSYTSTTRLRQFSSQTHIFITHASYQAVKTKILIYMAFLYSIYKKKPCTYPKKGGVCYQLHAYRVSLFISLNRQFTIFFSNIKRWKRPMNY